MLTYSQGINNKQNKYGVEYSVNETSSLLHGVHRKGKQLFRWSLDKKLLSL